MNKAHIKFSETFSFVSRYVVIYRSSISINNCSALRVVCAGNFDILYSMAIFICYRKVCLHHIAQGNFWLSKTAQNNFEWVIQTDTKQRPLALLLITYGQLLIACKLNSAFEYLDQGLLQAADFLSPTDYFQIINRHELLSVLPLFAKARTPANLLTLENEAKILSRLKQGQPRLTGNFGSTPRR